MEKITTFLMFEGTAEQAMNFYISVFPNSQITNFTRYKAGEPGAEGSVKQAAFSLNGKAFLCIDSPVKHQFSFTPAMSLFVDCESEAKVEKLAQALSTGGTVLMPLNVYPFSKKYTWLTDQFGVSWQLSYNK